MLAMSIAIQQQSCHCFQWCMPARCHYGSKQEGLAVPTIWLYFQREPYFGMASPAAFAILLSKCSSHIGPPSLLSSFAALLIMCYGSPAAAVPPGDGLVWYAVSEGETLESVAQSHGQDIESLLALAQERLNMPDLSSCCCLLPEVTLVPIPGSGGGDDCCC
jgi:hypothetical protein